MNWACGKIRVDKECVHFGRKFSWKEFGRGKRRWEDNIKMDLERIGCEVESWM
jgi:hypothetical protein